MAYLALDCLQVCIVDGNFCHIFYKMELKELEGDRSGKCVKNKNKKKER
jgi:hypothetical protein